jgi:hypothetical protein
MNREPNAKEMSLISITSIKAYVYLFINTTLGAISFFGVTLDEVVRVLTLTATLVLLPYTIKKLKEDLQLKRRHRELLMVQKKKELILLEQEEQKLAAMLLKNKRNNGIYEIENG